MDNQKPPAYVWAVNVPLPGGYRWLTTIDVRSLGFDHVQDMKTCKGWEMIVAEAVKRQMDQKLGKEWRK